MLARGIAIVGGLHYLAGFTSAPALIPRGDEMLLQQSTSYYLYIPLNFPEIVAGVPNYGTADSWIIFQGTTSRAGLGGIGNILLGPDGSPIAVVHVLSTDFTTLGVCAIFVKDAAGDVIGSQQVQIVSYNPYT